MEPDTGLMIAPYTSGLIVLLVLGMHETHIERSLSATFSGCALSSARSTLAALLAVTDRLALVAQLLAPRERDFDLCIPGREVDTRRNEGQALFLRLADQALDLGFRSNSFLGRSGSWP